MYVIMKSGKKNWSGKEFSDLPAKIYQEPDDAICSLKAYWYWELRQVDGELRYIPCDKFNIISIIPLNEKKLNRLLDEKKIRW